MTRPRFSFRPNLQNAEHRRAWEILQTVPEGQKSAFLVKAILESERKETLESTLRRVLREEIKAVPFQPVEQPEESIPQEMMGFLGSLMEE
ncbi:plasmid segregation centromere-binding protein ParR [[Clostridium] leptum]|nr:plasmid segregation centromere-binding protein ParR [[Clostridium] leptum]